jgi:hypothetical protein
MSDKLTYLPIEEVVDFVTKSNQQTQSKNYATRVRGFRFDTPGLLQRDWGTIGEFPNYPTTSQVNGFRLPINDEEREYPIWVGYDSSGNLRIHVWNFDLNRWDELTRVIKAHLASSPGASDTIVTLSNFTDILGNAVSLSDGDLNDYIAVNNTLGNSAAYVSVSTATTITSVVVLGSIGLGWSLNDNIWLYRMTGILPDSILGTGRGYEFMEGSNPHIRFAAVETQKKVNMYYGNSASTPILRQPIQIRKSVATSFGSFSGSPIYYYPIDHNHRRPIHLFLTDAYIGNDPTIMPDTAYSLGNSTAVGSLNTKSGWYIDKAQLSPDYQASPATSGAAIPNRIAVGGSASTTLVIGEGITIKCDFTCVSDGESDHRRYYITALYRGAFGSFYQESDPIAQVFLSPNVVGGLYQNGSPNVTFTFELDLARLNKTIAGFKLYSAFKTDSDGIHANLSRWQDDATPGNEFGTTYVEDKTVLLSDSGWSNVSTVANSLQKAVTLTKDTFFAALAAAAPNIDSNLGHSIDKNRSYMTPPYAVSVGHEDALIMAVLQDDTTLRLSSVDGSGVSEDDNFPDDSDDNLDRKQKLGLWGHGQVLGVSKLGSLILILRSTELETYDIQSESHEIYTIDCYSKDSILGLGKNESPIGVAWAGKAGIWLLPSGGSLPHVLNPLWVNFYDGSLMIADGVTPFVTDDQRRSAKFGYSETYRSIMCTMNVNKEDGSGTETLTFIYSLDRRKWYVREFNLSGAIEFFNARTDGSLVIGTTNGLLRYPNRSTYPLAHPYEDDVAWNGTAGVSASRGIPTRIRLTIGEVYSLDPSAVIQEFLMDFAQQTDYNGLAEITFYANGRAVGATRRFRVNREFDAMVLEDIGQIRSFEVQIDLPDANLHKFKKFDISRQQIGYSVDAKVGVPT